MTEKLVHGVFRRVSKGQIKDLLTGKIHQSFTVAADQLYQRGYMTEDERIALSGAIGKVLPEFQEQIDDNVGSRTVDTNDLRAIAEMSMVKRTHSRTKCMECDSKPTIACHWANGHGMAWFCKKHFKSWLDEDDRVVCGVWVLEDGECPEDIRKTPKGTEKVRKLGEAISQSEIYSRIDELTKRGGPGSGYHGHAGRPGEVGGSQPRAATSTPSVNFPKSISHSDIVKSKSVKWAVTRGGRVVTLPYEGTTHSNLAEVAGIKGETSDFHIRGWSANLKNRDVIADVFYIINFFGQTSDRAILNLDRVAKEVERFGPEMRDKPRAIYFSYDGGSTAQRVGVEELTERGVYILRGGPGSGHHGHRGIRGQTGGSLPRSKGTHLGGLGVPDMKDASKRSFVSQRIIQVDDETVVALVSLRRLDVFKTKPYRMESRWYVKDRKGPATEAQQSAGADLLGDLEVNTAQIMEISGWNRSTYRDNLWVAPWGSVLHIPTELTTRGGEGSGHFGHAGRQGEVGGSQSGKGGPTGGVARPRHAAGVTPVSVEGSGGQTEELPQEQELQMTSLQAYLDQPTQRSEDGIFGVAYTDETWTDLATEIMKNQPPEIQEMMAEAERKIREGTQSIEEYRDPETGEWNPERRALHERIIQGIMKEAGEASERPEGENPQLWVTGGLPGSGKTGVLDHRGGLPEGTVKIDSDRIKSMFPEYEGWNAALLHEESSAVVQELARRAVSEGRDIVYDATLKTTSNAEALVDYYESQNYGVNIIYVDVPMAMSIERAINRFATQGGRYVSPMYIATHDSKNVKSLAEIRDSVTSWEHWDNSQPIGQPPTLLATGGREADNEGETDAL